MNFAAEADYSTFEPSGAQEADILRRAAERRFVGAANGQLPMTWEEAVFLMRVVTIEEQSVVTFNQPSNLTHFIDVLEDDMPNIDADLLPLAQQMIAQLATEAEVLSLQLELRDCTPTQFVV